MGTSLATPKGEKLEEMFDPASRLITYMTKGDATNSPSISTEDLLGFAAIRFDTEDTLDSQEYEDGVRTTVVYMCVRGSSTSLEAYCVVSDTKCRYLRLRGDKASEDGSLGIANRWQKARVCRRLC